MLDAKPATRIRWRGKVPSFSDARVLLQHAGDAALVERGHPRWLVLSCPCGCGDEVAVNIDNGAGKAWRVRSPGTKLTVYPSVWRDDGCFSHFVIWRGAIHLFSPNWNGGDDQYLTEELIGRVADSLTATPAHFSELAVDLDEDPWSVLVACRQLVEQGQALEDDGKFSSLIVR